jgi:hypothetical protein
MIHTASKPELAPDRIAGYSAMANAIITMFERSDYHDPAGPADFQERVDRLIPVKPGFLQLADWFLAKHGAIKLATNKKGRTVMADTAETFAWRRFVLDNADRMKIHTTEHLRGMESDLQGRGGHVQELVEGSQYLFAYRAADLEVGVVISARASGFRREFDANGDEIPGSRRAWGTESF